MNFYVTDSIDPGQMHAGPKARTDAEEIMRDRGYRALELPRAAKSGPSAAKARAYRRAYDSWDAEEEFGLVVFQYPMPDVLPNLAALPERFGRHKSVALVHDLDSVRFPNGGANNVRAVLADRLLLPRFDFYISHNAAMTDLLVRRGIPGDRVVALGAFDYLAEGHAELVADRPYELVVAGSLDTEKCGYLLELPDAVRRTAVRLYGVQVGPQPEAPNVEYAGAFQPAELVARLRGSFGLVWDGTTAKTCAGRFGEYLRYNDPHKLSLYLAAGMPVVTWRKAAVAPFVKSRGLGVLVDSLDQVDDVLEGIGPAEYAQLAANAALEGERIRAGAHLRGALADLEARL